MVDDFDDFDDFIKKQGRLNSDPEALNASLDQEDDDETEFRICPSCKEEIFDLHILEEFTKLALFESGVEVGYDSVCLPCLNKFNEQITYVGRQNAEKKQRLNLLLAKWNNKLEFLKTGRSLMSQKIYPEAKKYFEEYLEILEAVFNKGEEGIKPMMIPKAHRRHEATVLCHILWDLIFIYDQFDPGTAKLQHTCNMLCDFVPHARGQGSVITKIRKHIKKANNPKIIKTLFTKAKNVKSGCFIATAVFDEPYSVELTVLRNFRDLTLKKYKPGRIFIFYYYKYSPNIAEKIKAIPVIKYPVKHGLKLISFILVKLQY